LTKITCDIFVCVVGVWQRDFLDLWCVYLVRRTRHTGGRGRECNEVCSSENKRPASLFSAKGSYQCNAYNYK